MDTGLGRVLEKLHLQPPTFLLVSRRRDREGSGTVPLTAYHGRSAHYYIVSTLKSQALVDASAPIGPGMVDSKLSHLDVLRALILVYGIN